MVSIHNRAVWVLPVCTALRHIASHYKEAAAQASEKRSAAASDAPFRSATIPATTPDAYPYNPRIPSTTARNSSRSPFGLESLEDEEPNRQVLLQKLKERQAQVEAGKPALDGALRENLEKFGALIGLSSCERQILGFAVLIHSPPGLEVAADSLDGLTSVEAIDAVSEILELPPHPAPEKHFFQVVLCCVRPNTDTFGRVASISTR